MKRKPEHFSIDRIAAMLKQAEPSTADGGVGEPVISDLFCGRRRRHAGLPPRQLKELRQLQSENKRLKKLVTKLRLDKSILENVARLCSAYKLNS
jgi:hypothetical protein